jgi:hypothetical protein
MAAISISSPVSRFHPKQFFELLFHGKNQDKEKKYRVQATCTQCEIAVNSYDIIIVIK